MTELWEADPVPEYVRDAVIRTNLSYHAARCGSQWARSWEWLLEHETDRLRTKAPTSPQDAAETQVVIFVQEEVENPSEGQFCGSGEGMGPPPDLQQEDTPLP